MNAINTYQQTRWSLADLFPSAEASAMQQAFSNLEQLVAQFETIRPALTETLSPADFLLFVRQLEEINIEGGRLYGYANLLFSEDTQNQPALSLLTRVQQLFAELTNRTLFFSLWWKDLADAPAEKLMAVSGDYRYWLEEMRHFKPHTLSEAEEKIINIKDVTGASALSLLYDSITNRYTFKLKVDGETKDLTRGELMIYPRDVNPDLRAAAYQELYRVYGNDGPILGQIYQTLVRDWRNEQVGLRKFTSPLSARNLSNDIPDEVVNILLEVCQKNRGVFERFFKLKAHWLNIPRLRRNPHKYLGGVARPGGEVPAAGWHWLGNACGHTRIGCCL